MPTAGQPHSRVGQSETFKITQFGPTVLRSWTEQYQGQNKRGQAHPALPRESQVGEQWKDAYCRNPVFRGLCRETCAAPCGDLDAAADDSALLR